MIVPALLTNDVKKLEEMLDVCAGFTDYAQIDIMDGEFVPSLSIGKPELEGLKLPLSCEAHLMVSRPLDWLKALKKIGIKKVIYHFEIQADHKFILSEIKKEGLGLGIAVNPATKISEFKFLLEYVDTILFLAVNPGFYGSPFIPEILEKVKFFKDEFPGIQSGIDGGVKLDNLLAVKACGVDYICVGSAILKEKSPKEAFEKFQRVFNG
ncbi:MAG: ribulose-phosphate 3-epimerase [Candidatus Omnitrophica bacterium]|nr:ribulose-phosphate 3-epimerase [Candidatus Omnitrophota bacterium]MDD5430348.1 ribulose-phosphate 3-epimerase [Candidatus Omnitrophota bacterium]